MHRIRLTLPVGQCVRYRLLDILHDALVNAWVQAGAAAGAVIGHESKPWTFAPLGGNRGKDRKYTHSLIVSTPDSGLADYLRRFDPAAVAYARVATNDSVNFGHAAINVEDDPIPPGGGAVGVLLLSPMALSVAGGKPKRWHTRLDIPELADAINARLSRLAGRPVGLQIKPDSLYLRANPGHSVLVPLKQDKQGRISYVIALSAPLVLAGSEADLRFAWHAGLGEKTRNGFGCLGLAEEGVGR